MHVIARKKPVEVEAMKYSKDNEYDIEIFCPYCEINNKKNTLSIETTEGVVSVHLGDWIIKGVNGEFYPCKSDVFEKTYDIVTEFGG